MNTIVKFLMAAALAMTSGDIFAAELAILPYRVDDPSSLFSKNTGIDYSRLLSLGSALLKKGVFLTSARDIEADLDRLKMTADSNISADDLEMLGGSLRIDYFLLGTLFKKGEKFISESVLYSVRDHRIAQKIRTSASSLEKLAEKEISEALSRFSDSSGGYNRQKKTDLVFVIDASYSMQRDWALVSEALTESARHLIDVGRVDARIHVVPFNDKAALSKKIYSENSIIAVENGLSGIKPAGGISSENFSEAMSFASTGVRWRQDSNKIMIIIINSKEKLMPSLARYALLAKNRGVRINAVTLGNLNREEAESVAQLVDIGGGKCLSAAYYQKFYDLNSAEIHAYMQWGRLFISKYPEKEWKNGVVPGRSKKRAREYLDEIYSSSGKVRPNPYDMAPPIIGHASTKIIGREPLELNISDIIKSMIGTDRAKTRDIAGRALVSDDKISLWMDLPDEEWLGYFSDREKEGVMTTIGVSVKRDPGQAYGFSLMPKILKADRDHVPAMLFITLADFQKKIDAYARVGFLYPPLWFVKVKIEKVEGRSRPRDIRSR